MAGDGNVVLWAGLSPELFELLTSDPVRDAVDLWPAHLLVYLCNGGLLNLPIARRPPRAGYRQPHWAPAVFRPRRRPRPRTPVRSTPTTTEGS